MDYMLVQVHSDRGCLFLLSDSGTIDYALRLLFSMTSQWWQGRSTHVWRPHLEVCLLIHRLVQARPTIR